MPRTEAMSGSQDTRPILFNQRLPLVSPAADRTADLLYLYVPHRKLPRTQAAYGNAEGREGKGQSRLANPATGHPVALKCDGQPQLVHLA
jgi:hypothetical protein